MTLVRHELKQGRTAFLIWTTAVGGLLVVCVFLFPEMKGEMEGVSDIFGSMGAFSGNLSASSVWSAAMCWGWEAPFLPRSARWEF